MRRCLILSALLVCRVLFGQSYLLYPNIPGFGTQAAGVMMTRIYLTNASEWLPNGSPGVTIANGTLDYTGDTGASILGYTNIAGNPNNRWSMREGGLSVEFTIPATNSTTFGPAMGIEPVNWENFNRSLMFQFSMTAANLGKVQISTGGQWASGQTDSGLSATGLACQPGDRIWWRAYITNAIAVNWASNITAGGSAFLFTTNLSLDATGGTAFKDPTVGIPAFRNWCTGTHIIFTNAYIFSAIPTPVEYGMLCASIGFGYNGGAWTNTLEAKIPTLLSSAPYGGDYRDFGASGAVEIDYTNLIWELKAKGVKHVLLKDTGNNLYGSWGVSAQNTQSNVWNWFVQYTNAFGPTNVLVCTPWPRLDSDVSPQANWVRATFVGTLAGNLGTDDFALLKNAGNNNLDPKYANDPGGLGHFNQLGFYTVGTNTASFLNALWGHDSTTITANSCSAADVQAAINAASLDDTVVVPAGNCTWSSQVTGTNQIWLQGSGTNVTAIKHGNGSAYDLSLTLGTLEAIVSGFQFTAQSAGQAFNGMVHMNGIAWRSCSNLFVVDDVGGMYTDGNGGLIDHNMFTKSAGSGGGEGVRMFGTTNNWNGAFPYGTTNMVVIENNLFWFNRADNGADDAYNGAQYCFRSNIVVGTWENHHGADSGSYRAPLGCEAYNNLFTNNASSLAYGFESRGGTGIYATNGFFGNWNVGVYLADFRAGGTSSQCATNLSNCPPWGSANGVNPWDGNLDPVTGWPTLDEIGRTGPTTFTSTNSVQVSCPVYVWGTSGSFAFAALGADAPTVMQNRDYYAAPDPNWTALAWPHPLISGVPAGAGSAACVGGGGGGGSGGGALMKTFGGGKLGGGSL